MSKNKVPKWKREKHYGGNPAAFMYPEPLPRPGTSSDKHRAAKRKIKR